MNVAFYSNNVQRIVGTTLLASLVISVIGGPSCGENCRSMRVDGDNISRCLRIECRKNYFRNFMRIGKRQQQQREEQQTRLAVLNNNDHGDVIDSGIGSHEDYDDGGFVENGVITLPELLQRNSLKNTFKGLFSPLSSRLREQRQNQIQKQQLQSGISLYKSDSVDDTDNGDEDEQFVSQLKLIERSLVEKRLKQLLQLQHEQ